MIFDLFFSCLAAPFRVRFRLRLRLRARLFPSFKVKDIKFASPGSLNPWVAAGGREAIRIKIELVHFQFPEGSFSVRFILNDEGFRKNAHDRPNESKFRDRQ